MYRAAVIGCGWIGGGRRGTDQPYTHAGAYRQSGVVCLVAACDVDKIRLSRFRENWGAVNLYEEVSDFLAHERVDLLSVCTWDLTHTEIVRHAVEAGAARAIICEKPLAQTAAAAREIVELCERRGISLYVNYQRRWDPNYQVVHQWLAAGECGVIRAVHGYYTRGLFHNGTAWINLLRMLVGEVVCVRALPGENREIPDDPTLSAWLELKNGAATIMCGVGGNDYSLFEMDIVGSGGRVVLADSGRDIRFYRVREDADYPGFRHLELVANELRPQQSGYGLTNLVREAVANLSVGRLSANSAREAVRDLEIAELVRRSAENQGATLSLSC